MLKSIATAILFLSIVSISAWSAGNCSNDIGYLFTRADKAVNPLDSGFRAAFTSARFRAHLILKEDLDSAADKIMWQPKAQYFKGVFQAKGSKNSVITLFDRESGLWAYQVKSKTVGSDSVCISTRRVDSAITILTGKVK